MRAALAVAAGVLVAASPAFGGLFENIFFGLQVAATPSGSPVIRASSGLRVNGQRTGRVRLVPNVPGQGFRLEFDRGFGNDALGRPEVLDLGPLELQLQGQTTATVDVTRRFIPTLTSNVQFNNLSYSLRAKSGLEDVELQGTLNLTQNFEINPLGFYRLQLDIRNSNGISRLSGVLDQSNIEQVQDTNFEIGPISVRGNIYVDGILALLNALGVDVSGAEQAFPLSPIDRINDAINKQLRGQARILIDPASARLLPAQQPLFAAELAQPTGSDGVVVPEPLSLLLWGGGIVTLAVSRRRMRVR